MRFGVEFFIEVVVMESILASIGARKVLDVGSGSGLLGYILRSRGYEFIGLDIDCSHSLIDCVEADARNPLPFPDKSFDVVVSQHFIEHVDCELQEQVLREMARVARKAVIVITPNRNYPWKPPDGPYNPEHVCLLGLRETRKLFEKVFNGNTIVRAINNFIYVSRRYYKLLSLIEKLFPKPTILAIGFVDKTMFLQSSSL